MAKAIHKQKSGHPTNAHDITEKYSCDSDDPKCMKNICETCQPAKIIQSWDVDSQLSEIDASESSDYDESENISFTMLIHENNIIKKVIKCLEQKEFYNDWEQMVIEFKENTHRKQIQVAA